MFNIEYKFTHTYEDKFTKPFQRSINLAEKDLNKLSTQTAFAVNNISQEFEKLNKNAKIDFKVSDIEIPDLKDIEKTVKFESKIETPKTNIEDKTFNITPVFKNVSTPDLKDQTVKINTEISDSFKKINKEETYEFKPQMAFTSQFKKQFKQIEKKFNALENLKIKPDDKELKKIEKQPLQVEADIKPDTKELEKVEKGGFHLNMAIANIDTGDAKDQLLSFSESLYEATKYGINKANLGKEIAKQVKKLDGLVSMSEMGNAVVSALKVGIRGSEKELAQYAKEIQKFHELTGKSYEESAQLIYKIKDKFKMPAEGIEKVIDEIAVLRKNFAVTEDDLTNALEGVKQEFGYLTAAMDKATKSKFMEGMLKWSASLEQMHINAKESMDIVNKALEGDNSALRLLSKSGMSISEIQKSLQSGDIETVAKAYEQSVISIGKQLKSLPPIARKQYMQMYGLTEDMASAYMEAADNAQEFQKQTEKAFSIKIEGGEAQKQWEEATNPFTKGLQKIQNQIMAFFGDIMPGEIFDAFSEIDSLLLLAVSNKFGVFNKLKGIGTGIGSKILGGIKGVFTKTKGIKPPIETKGIIPKALKPSMATSAIKAVDKVDDVAKVANATSKVGKFSKALGFLGKFGKLGKVGIIGSVIGGALTIGSALTSNEGNKTEKVSKAVGSVGGSATGTAIGAAIGSAILPGIGTAIGGFLGSIAGGWIGEKLGGVVGDKISSEDNKPKQLLEKPQKKEKQEEQQQPDELLNAIYALQSQLSSINTNTSFIVQMNQLMAQYIELLKMMAKQSGQNIDDVLKGFNR